MTTLRIRKKTIKGGKVRISTNGQANLIHGYSVPPLLEGLVDKISISIYRKM